LFGIIPFSLNLFSKTYPFSLKALKNLKALSFPYLILLSFETASIMGRALPFGTANALWNGLTPFGTGFALWNGLRPLERLTPLERASPFGYW
jgi:hypothetical protein